MSDESAADDDAAKAAPPSVGELESTLDTLDDRVEGLEAELEAAETEADLDDVEATLEAVQDDVEAVEVPEPPEPPADEDDDEVELEDPYEDAREHADTLEDRLDDVDDGIEDQRGPYAEDVIGEVDDAAGDIESTRWAEEGETELREVLDDALSSINAALDTSLSLADDGELVDRLVATLERVGTEIDEAELDPDEDAETIADLLETTDALQTGIDESTAWSDLEVREQLRREGFYDVLDHVKDFPPEWHALKVHEKRGDVEMILLALDSLDSGFMEEHCLESLKRMGSEEAIEPMVQRAKRRDVDAIEILGKIGVADEQVVNTLLDYVDAGDMTQRKTTLRALGELGAEEAVEPIAQQLDADEPEARSHAARALGLIGDTRAIEPLTTVLEEADDDTVRASAAWALNAIGTADALEAVAPYADDRAYLVQVEAERAR